MSGYFRVVGWDDKQHYRDRDPVWIKLHRTLLDNYEFSRLQDASKSHLMLIWLLAARHNNRVPADPVWVGQRIGATTPVDLQVLADAGFIELEHDASTALAGGSGSAMLEERREEGEKRRGDAAPTAEEQQAATVMARLEREHHRDAFMGFRKAAKNPKALTAEVVALASGMPGHGPGYGWEAVGQALHELAVAGSQCTATALRAFVRKVASRPPDGPAIEMVTDDNGVEQPAYRNGDGTWHYLTPEEKLARLAG